MILNEPEQTPADLTWTMFGIPVRVNPWFWVFTAMLGWSWVSDGLVYLFMWIGCVFFSILLHELGHVWMGQVFGSRGHIVLHSFGGLAIGSSNLPWRWQRIAVFLAGPGIQFLVLIPVLAAQQAIPPGDVSPYTRTVLYMLRTINLYWPILNLLPIWPLDGGQATRELCSGAWPRENAGLRASLIISMIVSGALAVEAFMVQNRQHFLPAWLMDYLPIGGGMYMILFFVMFAFQSYQLLQKVPAGRSSDDELPWERHERRPWEQDPDHWKR